MIEVYSANIFSLLFVVKDFWARHIQICFDVLEGLSYLQNNMNDKLNVIHRDIKSGNIILDDAWDDKNCSFLPLQDATSS